MVTPEQNRDWWEIHSQGTLNFYKEYLVGKTVQDDVDEGLPLERIAWNKLGDGFKLLVADYKQEAYELLDLAIEAAEEALRTEDFEAMISSPNIPPDMKMADNLNGKCKTHRYLENAIWLRTGKRSLDLLVQCAHWHLKLYEMKAIQSGYTDLEKLMSDLLQAREFATAIELYHDSKYAKKPINDLRSGRSAVRAYYLVAEHAMGNKSHEALAVRVVEYWYSVSSNWTQFMPWWERLTWAYLRGRYFTEKTELQSLLTELRGY